MISEDAMIKNYLHDNKVWVDTYLADVLEDSLPEYQTLYDAMRYSLLLGGKRIRPILTKAVMEALGVSADAYKNVVCAIELVHTYSLIHDDLPAMDDDDYRRGQLTNHKKFGEAMAILAGDGLLTEAFSLIGRPSAADAFQQMACIKVLADAAGPAGMVGGQAMDISSEGKALPLGELQVLHRGKTGALFSAAVTIGLLLSRADEATTKAFQTYADYLGLLFQITDDILDVVGTIEELGKTPGSDERLDKSTYTSLLGLDGARAKAQETAEAAKAALIGTKADTTVLTALVDYLISRTN